jgi:hypothetical protein
MDIIIMSLNQSNRAVAGRFVKRKGVIRGLARPSRILYQFGHAGRRGLPDEAVVR